jgi:hypothetical protein
MRSLCVNDGLEQPVNVYLLPIYVELLPIVEQIGSSEKSCSKVRIDCCSK